MSTDQFVPPTRPIEKPFRCCIADIFKGFHFVCVCVPYIYVSFIVTVTCHLPLLLPYVSSAPGSGFNVAGRIESGHIQLGESVLVLPANETASIKGETRSQQDSFLVHTY